MGVNDYKDDKDNFSKYKDVKTILKYGIPFKEIPDISFVIPTYKRFSLLKNSIDSIINQPEVGLSYEIIVIDNDCFDFRHSEAETILKKYPKECICYYQNKENIGMFGNWNRCFEIAKAKWIAMLHDDDLLSADYMVLLKKILKKIKNKNKVILVKAKMISIKNGEFIFPNKFKSRLFKMYESRLIPYSKRDLAIIGPENVGILGACSCGSLMKKDTYLKYGGFDDSHFPCADAYYPERLVTKHGYKAYISFGVFGYYRWEENTQYKESTLIGNAKEYMQYRQYYKKRDWLSKMIYLFFEKEMLYGTKENILKLGKVSKYVVMNNFKKEVDKIMGTNIPYSAVKKRIYDMIRYIYYRVKVLKAIIIC